MLSYGIKMLEAVVFRVSRSHSVCSAFASGQRHCIKADVLKLMYLSLNFTAQYPLKQLRRRSAENYCGLF